MQDRPWVGQSWEGFVIEQTLAALAAAGRPAQPFFFRTSDGYELDLVLDRGGELWAVEIKLTSEASPELLARLEKTAGMIGAARRVLVCRTAETVETENLLVTDVAGCLERVGG